MDMQGKENKLSIGIFGRCNVGKSTIVNTLTSQSTSIVSAHKGTTTDIVKKTIEITDIGSVTIVDTAGLDDTSPLGKERKKRTIECFSQIDFAVIVTGENIFGEYEKEIIDKCNKLNLPYHVVYNKADIFPVENNDLEKTALIISREYKDCREKLLTMLRNELKKLKEKDDAPLLTNLIKQGDIVLLIAPIDSSAPKGRLILPQVKTIREILDKKAIAITIQPSEIEKTISCIGQENIALAITDSQVFSLVDKILPQSIPLTSFSILLAKEKGNFPEYLKGTAKIDLLKDGDRILILESCSHTPTCEDIGRVKLPKLLKLYTGKELRFDILAGLSNDFADKGDYSLVIQCGGCMATKKQMKNRLDYFIQKGIPVTNYGMAISYTNGIFNRATEIFKKQENKNNS